MCLMYQHQLLQQSLAFQFVLRATFRAVLTNIIALLEVSKERTGLHTVHRHVETFDENDTFLNKTVVTMNKRLLFR